MKIEAFHKPNSKSGISDIILPSSDIQYYVPFQSHKTNNVKKWSFHEMKLC
jgi:hypothetical protein